MPITPKPARVVIRDPEDSGEIVVGNVKIIRPVALTRPSNDDITNLIKFSIRPETDQSISNTPVYLTPQISQQKSERRIMTRHYPEKNTWRIIALFMWSFCGGFTDAAPGALLPTIEKHYGISYSIVSLIWMSNAAGYILVALFAHMIQQWLGKAKSIPVGCISSIVMFAFVSSGGPFPVIVTGFFFGGMGLAIVLAQANVFLSKLDKNSLYLALFHGGYGAGATVSPLIATAMVEKDIKWNYVYLIMLALMIINFVNTTFAFKGSDEDLKPWDHDEETTHLMDDSRPTTPAPTPLETEQGIGLQELGVNPVAPPESTTEPASNMRLALKSRITWLISMFVFCYQGSEVAMGGWIVSYLIDFRKASTSYGYVLSGFFGGLTMGRFLLTRPLHKFLGVRRGIIVIVLCTILCVTLAWVTTNNIVLSAFVSLAGVCIGPVYPLMVTNIPFLLPRKIQVVSLTIITAFGSSGGAVVPLLTGLLAQSSGTYVVLPIFIATYSMVLVIWLSLPNVERKSVEKPATKLQEFLHHVW